MAHAPATRQQTAYHLFFALYGELRQIWVKGNAGYILWPVAAFRF